MAIRLEIVGYFNVSPSYPKEQVERLVKTNASSILYSIAREMVRSITAAGPLFVSTNSGRSWLPATNLDRYWLAITCSSDGSKMAAQAIGDIVVPLVSTNYGETWESTAPLLNQSGSLASTAEGNKLMLAGGTGFYVSTNWGLTWFSTNHQAPVYGNIPMVCSANGSLILSCGGVGFEGGLYTSTNFGSTWISNNVSPEVWTAFASSADGNKLVAIAEPYGGVGAVSGFHKRSRRRN